MSIDSDIAIMRGGNVLCTVECLLACWGVGVLDGGKVADS